MSNAADTNWPNGALPLASGWCPLRGWLEFYADWRTGEACGVDAAPYEHETRAASYSAWIERDTEIAAAAAARVAAAAREMWGDEDNL